MLSKVKKNSPEAVRGRALRKKEAEETRKEMRDAKKYIAAGESPEQRELRELKGWIAGTWPSDCV